MFWTPINYLGVGKYEAGSDDYFGHLQPEKYLPGVTKDKSGAGNMGYKDYDSANGFSGRGIRNTLEWRKAFGCRTDGECEPGAAGQACEGTSGCDSSERPDPDWPTADKKCCEGGAMDWPDNEPMEPFGPHSFDPASKFCKVLLASKYNQAPDKAADTKSQLAVKSRWIMSKQTGVLYNINAQWSNMPLAPDWSYPLQISRYALMYIQLLMLTLPWLVASLHAGWDGFKHIANPKEYAGRFPTLSSSHLSSLPLSLPFFLLSPSF